ncbi:hypothetical protein E4U41_002661 [Claviceps citrina]|nr:hypothetical protein E4U41_002661 [Claviceps citrina]
MPGDETAFRVQSLTEALRRLSAINALGGEVLSNVEAEVPSRRPWNGYGVYYTLL